MITCNEVMERLIKNQNTFSLLLCFFFPVFIIWYIIDERKKMDKQDKSIAVFIFFLTLVFIPFFPIFFFVWKRVIRNMINEQLAHDFMEL